MIENVGLDNVGGSPYDTAWDDTSAKFKENRYPRVGSRKRYQDGREFVLCSTQSVVAAGEMVAHSVAAAEIAGASGVVGTSGTPTVTLVTTSTSFFGGSNGVIAANRLAGGFLHIVDDTGEGYTYRIKSHTAGTATANVTFTLYDNLKVALDSTSDAVVTPNPFDIVIQSTATLRPIGVAMVPTTGATSSLTKYFWVQTKGPATALGTGTVGKPVIAIAAGAVQVGAEADDGVNVVGVCLATSASGHVAVWLDL